MDFLMYLVLGACSGVLAGLFGIGGGLVIVPVLVFSFAAQGVSEQVLTHLAVGTSLAAILFTSINSVLANHTRQTLPPLVSSLRLSTLKTAPLKSHRQYQK